MLAIRVVTGADHVSEDCFVSVEARRHLLAGDLNVPVVALWYSWGFAVVPWFSRMLATWQQSQTLDYSPALDHGVSLWESGKAWAWDVPLWGWSGLWDEIWCWFREHQPKEGSRIRSTSSSHSVQRRWGGLHGQLKRYNIKVGHTRWLPFSGVQEAWVFCSSPPVK